MNTPTSTSTSTSTFPVPAARNDTVRIPAGTVVHTTAPTSTYTTKRAQTVTVFDTTSGYINPDPVDHAPHGALILPTICWVGSGGYWRYAQVTPEVAAANNWPLPPLPDVPRGVGDSVSPSWEGEGNNRWGAAS